MPEQVANLEKLLRDYQELPEISGDNSEPHTPTIAPAVP